MYHMGIAETRINVISRRFADASPFHTLWLHELEVPIFASLTITSPNRYVICCLVDGHIVAIDSTGSVMWRVCILLLIVSCLCDFAPQKLYFLFCHHDES
ncbi:hypothetical protein Pint_20853 [Pistacia integerrima]|uniref:Uncharacterized protein n=1 Tax=Pistacia integerrima TaxID=434235 RepID=A0ACC0XAK8_9ROSI|nr:hypothetical protein Pint_20853 [Pistacia integerrima]